MQGPPARLQGVIRGTRPLYPVKPGPRVLFTSGAAFALQGRVRGDAGVGHLLRGGQQGPEDPVGAGDLEGAPPSALEPLSSDPHPSLGPPCSLVALRRLGSLWGAHLVWACSQALVAPWRLGGSPSLSEGEARVVAPHLCPRGSPDTGMAGRAPRAIPDGTAEPGRGAGCLPRTGTGTGWRATPASQCERHPRRAGTLTSIWPVFTGVNWAPDRERVGSLMGGAERPLQRRQGGLGPWFRSSGHRSFIISCSPHSEIFRFFPTSLDYSLLHVYISE